MSGGRPRPSGKGLTLGELAERLGLRLHGDAARVVDSVATLHRAQPGSLSFLANRRYRPALRATHDEAVVLPSELLADRPGAARAGHYPYAAFGPSATLLAPPPPERHRAAPRRNPAPAARRGSTTRLRAVQVCAIMAALAALPAGVASPRLTTHTNGIGGLYELRVIAAAVIGGTALSGGIGTIYGAILGALIMQSLQSGMAMVGVDAPFQNIVVGSVLVIAVFIDIVYRNRTGS